jgi:hypothetical protein
MPFWHEFNAHHDKHLIAIVELSYTSQMHGGVIFKMDMIPNGVKASSL